MDGLKFTSPYIIKQDGVFVGGILCVYLSVCLFVRLKSCVRKPPLVDWVSRDVFIPAT